jgi:hypothetical protein
MLRAFGFFLLVFSILSLIVRLQWMVYLFGIIAIILFAVDVVRANHSKGRSPL